MGAPGVTQAHAQPGVIAHLFEARGYVLFPGARFKNFCSHFGALLYNLFWMAYVLPGHVRTVQQAARALEVNKLPVSGDILDAPRTTR